MSDTHISIILDRTGSMESIRDDVIGGFNSFLESQQKEKGEATLTLVQFDSQDPYEVVHHVKPIKDVPKLSRKTYVPRAATPLLDAIGRGINDLEQSLADSESTQVVMAVITDGQENSSVEFNKAQIAKMIKEKQDKNKWQFVFLSADLDSFDDAGEYGFKGSSTLAYDRISEGVKDSFNSLSSRIADYRKKRIKDVTFSDEDRDKQESEKKRKKR